MEWHGNSTLNTTGGHWPEMLSYTDVIATCHMEEIGFPKGNKIHWEDPGVTLLEVKADCLSEGQLAEWCPKRCLADTVIFKVWISFR